MVSSEPKNRSKTRGASFFFTVPPDETNNSRKGTLGRATLTRTFIFFLSSCFVLEFLFHLGPVTSMRPSLLSLRAQGGLAYDLVLEKGEWYRMFTGTLLHADPLHLVMNLICLSFAGGIIERFEGRLFFLTVYLNSAFFGSLTSLLFNSGAAVSIGASGAIMGCLASGLVTTFQIQHRPLRVHLQTQLAQILIPSLLPIAVAGGGKVDVAAHLGGAVMGAGTTLLFFGLEKCHLHSFRKSVTFVLCMLGLGAAINSTSRAIQQYVQIKLFYEQNELEEENMIL